MGSHNWGTLRTRPHPGTMARPDLGSTTLPLSRNCLSGTCWLLISHGVVPSCLRTHGRQALRPIAKSTHHATSQAFWFP